MDITCKSYCRIQRATHLSLQSQVRNLPPRLRPRRELLRWLKAASGSSDMGLPSSASRVSDEMPVKAEGGRERNRLNPRSSTYNKIIFQQLGQSHKNTLNQFFGQF